MNVRRLATSNFKSGPDRPQPKARRVERIPELPHHGAAWIGSASAPTLLAVRHLVPGWRYAFKRDPAFAHKHPLAAPNRRGLVPRHYRSGASLLRSRQNAAFKLANSLRQSTTSA
jgi:hypothetical protein